MMMEVVSNGLPSHIQQKLTKQRGSLKVLACRHTFQQSGPILLADLSICRFDDNSLTALCSSEKENLNTHKSTLSC
jgi:hypothetical protein